MSVWNFDISAAPRDRQILMRTTRDGDKVFVTNWLEPTKHCPNGRFNGFSENAKTLPAWCEIPAFDNPPETVAGETGMVLGTGRERPLSIGLHTDGDLEARFETVSLHQNSKTDAAISRPGKPRPEIENGSDQEGSVSDTSGGMQDEIAIHPATNFILDDCGSGA